MNDYKRNYTFLFIDTMLFTNAMTFLSVNAVITYFLNTLGASTFEISLAGVLVSIGTLITQPIFANRALSLPIKKNMFAFILFIQRFLLLIFIFTIPIFAVSKPKLMVILFLIVWGVFSLFIGSYSPFYMSLLTKMIPSEQRGRLLGFSAAAGNIVAIGAAYLTGVIIKELVFPYNYTLVFIIGAILLIIDAADFLILRECPDKVIERDCSYFRFVNDIFNILRNNANIRKIILGNSLIVICNVSLVYYALYAIRVFHIEAAEVAVFTGITVVINTLGNFFYGILADKFGHRFVLKVAAMFGALAALIILSLHSIYAVYFAFALSNLCLTGYNLSCGMFVIQNSPHGQVPVYISLNNMTTLIISSIITLGSSYVIDKFSFTPVFSLTLITGICAYIVLGATQKK